MASKIILKKSSVASKVPVAGDLDFGELALNYTDSKLYFKKADGTTIDYFSVNTSTYIGATAPANPSAGQLWWVPDEGNLYVYYTDVDSAQWVPANVGGTVVNSGGSGTVDLSAIDQNVISSTTATYDFGSSTIRWKDAYFSGTIQSTNLKSLSTTTPTLFQNSSGTEIGKLCRAWVNFRGRDTVSISAAFNVSSITDLGVGNYRINFTNAMPDNLYCAVGGASTDAIANNGLVLAPAVTAVTTTVDYFNVTTLSFNSAATGSIYDPISVHVAVFR